MLKIRLQRTGRKHEPTFRVVLTDSRNSTKSGRFKEILGSYDPRIDHIQLNKERISHWLSFGTQVSSTLHNLLVAQGLVKGDKVNVLPRKAPIKKEPTEEEKAVAEAAAKAAAAPAPEKKAEEAPAAEAVVASEETKTEETPAEAAE